jgi:hypothetical protein
MPDYDNKEDLAHLFVVFADAMTGAGPMDSVDTSEIEVEYGVTRDLAVPGKVVLVTRERESIVYIETWELRTPVGEILGTFNCYDDRRRGWTRQGYSFGVVEREGETLYVWDVKAPVAENAD